MTLAIMERGRPSYLRGSALPFVGLTLGVLGTVLFLTAPAAASTAVPGGIIQNDTLWDAVGSPYLVSGNVTIAAGATLEIGDGVQVSAIADVGFLVNGTLRSNGTSLGVRIRFPAASSPPWPVGIIAQSSSIVDLRLTTVSGSSVGVSCLACQAFLIRDSQLVNVSGPALRSEGASVVAIHAVELVNVTSAGFFSNTTGASIANLTATGAHGGLRLQAINDSVLSNVSLEIAMGAGLHVQLSNRVLFSGATISATTSILIESCSLLDFARVTGYSLLGFSLQSSTFGVRNWEVSLREFDFSTTTGGGIDVSGTDGFEARDGRIGHGLSVGISVFASTDVLVQNVTVESSSVSVKVTASQNVRIISSKFLFGSVGVYAEGFGGGTSFLQIGGSTFLNQSAAPIRLVQSTDARISGNNIIDPGLPPTSTSGSGNLWDDGAAGNFWYPTPYADSDGNNIGDQAFAIMGDSNESDRFPRMLSLQAEKPSLAIQGPQEGPEDTPMVFSITAFDELRHVSVGWDAGPFVVTNWTTAFTAAWPDPGAYTVSAWAVNLAGLVASASVIVSIQDNTPPLLVVSPLPVLPAGSALRIDASNSTDNHHAFPANATLNVTITGPQGSVQLLSGTFPTVPVTLAKPGTYAVVVVLSDGAGNAARVAFSGQALDVNPPLIGVLEPMVSNEDEFFDLAAPEITDDDPFFLKTGMATWTVSRNQVPLLTSTGWDLHAIVADPGRVVVEFRACDAAGNCANATVAGYVNDTTPPDLSRILEFEVPYATPSPLSSTDALDNDLGWPSGASFTWTIQFPGGEQNFSGPTVVVTVDEPGFMRGELVASDRAGNVARKSFLIQVVDRSPPWIKIVGNSESEFGESFLLDASATSDSGELLSFLWDFGDGSAVKAGPVVSHVFLKRGNLEVRLTVTDAFGNSNTSRFLVRVVDTVPPAIRLLSPGDNNGSLILVIGETIRLSADAADASSVAGVSWEMGDGQSVEANQAEHAYMAPGTYVVTFLAVDSAGNVASTTFNVTVLDREVASSISLFVWAPLVIAAGALVGLAWHERRSRND